MEELNHENGLRTKFTVRSWEKNPDGSVNLTFTAAGVLGIPEERAYVCALPGGELKMIVPARSALAEREIERGKTFYLDLIPAEVRAAAR